MFSSGAPAPPSSVCLERPLSAVFPLSRFPIPLPKLSERGDGTARKEVLKELFLSKKSRMSVWPMPLANRLVPSPPANLWGGKGSGKGEGPLRFLPSPVCLLRYVGLEQEFAGGGTVLEHHGIGHGFEPLHTLRHFGGYGGDGIGKLMRAASPASSRFGQRAPSGPESGVARKRISWSGNAFTSSMVLASSSLVGAEP